MRFFLGILSLLATFTLVGCDSQSPLNARLEAIKNTTNLTENTEVIEDGASIQNNLFMRDGDFIYSDFTYHSGQGMELVVTMESGTRKGYQYDEDNDCWMFTDLEERQFRFFASQHSNVRMLPSSVELEWFEIDEDNQVYTLKRDFFDDLRARTNMSQQEHFNAYQLTLEDDALILDVNVSLVLDSGEVASIDYAIRFDNINQTDVEIPDFNLCPINTD